MAESCRSNGPRARSRQPATEFSPPVSSLNQYFMRTPAKHRGLSDAIRWLDPWYCSEVQLHWPPRHASSNIEDRCTASLWGSQAMCCKRGALCMPATSAGDWAASRAHAVRDLGGKRERGLACHVLNEVDHAQDIEFVLARPHPPVQPLAQLKHQVVHVSLHNSMHISPSP